MPTFINEQDGAGEGELRDLSLSGADGYRIYVKDEGDTQEHLVWAPVIDDFDDGDLDEWEAPTNDYARIDNTHTYQGQYALEMSAYTHAVTHPGFSDPTLDEYPAPNSDTDHFDYWVYLPSDGVGADQEYWPAFAINPDDSTRYSFDGGKYDDDLYAGIATSGAFSLIEERDGSLTYYTQDGSLDAIAAGWYRVAVRWQTPEIEGWLYEYPNGPDNAGTLLSNIAYSDVPSFFDGGGIGLRQATNSSTDPHAWLDSMTFLAGEPQA